MSSACDEFRTRLADALAGVLSASPRLEELAWHEHLLGCGACRELLEAEEALEVLLASLPDPQLPPALASRVLARLADERAARGDPLDALLELDRADAAPPDLAGDVLAALRPHRRAAREQVALDELLGRVPEPAVPEGLADRLLMKLEPHRMRARPRLLTRPIVRVLTAVAAALLIALGYLAWFGGAAGPVADEVRGPQDLAVVPTDPGGGELAPASQPGPLPEVVKVAPPPEPTLPITPQGPGDTEAWPSDELLASLDLLESWELLNADDLDLTLAALDEVDEVLLDLGAGGI
jgi:hypothetical protein